MLLIKVFFCAEIPEAQIKKSGSDFCFNEIHAHILSNEEKHSLYQRKNNSMPSRFSLESFWFYTVKISENPLRDFLS